MTLLTVSAFFVGPFVIFSTITWLSMKFNVSWRDGLAFWTNRVDFIFSVIEANNLKLNCSSSVMVDRPQFLALCRYLKNQVCNSE